MPSLIERAKKDWQRFTSDPDQFGTPINFLAPDPGNESADVVGLATEHHISIDSQGNPINAKNVHVSVAEELLTDAGYPVRNGSDEITLKGHKVSFKDARGILKAYQVTEMFPAQTVGMITLILEDFE